MGAESNHLCVCLYPLSWCRTCSANNSTQLCKADNVYLSKENCKMRQTSCLFARWESSTNYLESSFYPHWYPFNYASLHSLTPFNPLACTCSLSGQPTCVSTSWILWSSRIALTSSLWKHLWMALSFYDLTSWPYIFILNL